MIGGSEHLDAEDRAFLSTVVPENAMDPQLIAVVSWVDPDDGEGRWILYSPDDVEVSRKIGLLEIAKNSLMRCTLPRSVDDG